MSRHHLAVVLFISLCRLTLSRALHVDDADAQVVYNGEGSSAGRALACKLNAVKCASSWYVPSFRTRIAIEHGAFVQVVRAQCRVPQWLVAR